MSANWEENIIIAATKNTFETLSQASKLEHPKDNSTFKNFSLPKSTSKFEKKDSKPIPLTEDREGMYGENHYEYWLSGLSDYLKVSFAAKKGGIKLSKKSQILDFGCASGRVLRHFSADTKADIWGCDINENHVKWCNEFLHDSTKVFQNTSLPHLQFEDDRFDLIYALSVFTQIETFETAWLCELRRVLRPGGIIYATINDEQSWKTMPHDSGVGLALTKNPNFKPEWLESGFPGEKLVSRIEEAGVTSLNVFYKQEYLRKVWGKFFEILDIMPQAHEHQTAIILRKL